MGGADHRRTQTHAGVIGVRLAAALEFLVTVLAVGELLVFMGVAAASETERATARYALADLPLRDFLHKAVVPYGGGWIRRSANYCGVQKRLRGD